MKRKAINYEEFLESVDLLMGQGFRLKQEVYVHAIKQARAMSRRNLG